ncbi:MAG: hypothetical protein KY451_00480 [Actinobacteria bacterium]|nr:hypothetical protein [Actinomycetota bacterium]MBW3646930.1 hypothetical protein [Actinomycetota bacterium]
MTTPAPWPVPIRELVPGAVVELVGKQHLYDFTENPWRLYAAGEQLTVLSVKKLATGRLDRQPYEVSFLTRNGATVELEADSGEDLIHVVG